jgi:hypothetical protein
LAASAKQIGSSGKYCRTKLGFREADTDREEDSGRPFTDLCISTDDAFLSLVELEPGTSPERGHVVFYAKNLEKAQQWLTGRGVAFQPTKSDSGGNQFFNFHDLEGNAIEVCVEP